MELSKLRIVYITHNYLPFTGGVEIHVQQVAQTVSSRHQVRVCALKFANYSLPKRLMPLDNNLLAGMREKPRSDGAVEVVSLAPTTIGRCKMLPLLLRATPRLQRFYYHQINGLTHPFYSWAFEPIISRAIAGADIVHCMAFGDLGFTAERAAHRAGIPFVCTPFVHPGQWGDSTDDVKLYQRSAAVIALLPTDFRHLERIGVPRTKLHTIGVSPSLPESIDEQAFRRDDGLLENQPIILYLGRMMAQKGARSVVAAAPLVWKRVPSAHFIFAGPATNEEAAIFRGADQRLQFLGRVSDQRKAEALAACNLLCVPSTTEILPTVYLEAWSLGKPVIAGMAPGISELVEGNQAGICVPQQPEEIAQKIIGLLENPGRARAYGYAGKKLVEQRYSRVAVASALEEIYSRLNHKKKDYP
jgi:glycosyltransferase involved in cell wall biosynthesis